MSAIEPSIAVPQLEELRPRDLAPARSASDRFSALGAFFALVLVDSVSRIGGFHRLHGMVRCAPRLGRSDNPELVRKVSSAVDRACTYYFKKAWCLQRSATTTILLRLVGVDAQMVIGVEKFPFYAHAWVEVDGEVANDHPVVKTRYTELDRC